MPRALSRALLSFLLLAATAAAQDTPPERARAESELKRVLGDIAVLQQELGASRSEHRREQSRLRQLDLAIQEIGLRQRDLESEKGLHQARLRELEQQRAAYLASLDERLARLAVQVRAAYRGSRQSRTRLILNQDDPSRIDRMLAYYDYVNRAQVERIDGLREALGTLDTMQLEIDGEIARIGGLQREQGENLRKLEQRRQERNDMLRQIATRIDDDEAALRELEQNRRHLETLLERLSDALADIPEDLDQGSDVARLKGRLPMPVDGPVRHAFGQRRGAGLDWQGWLIGAPPGSEVRAVAYGRVAYSDWLRGYGLLLVIDHGNGFMSLYGHNESLLREAGEWVSAGQVIGAVGTNPGNEQGLYFELRRNGKAVDPAAWLAR